MSVGLVYVKGLKASGCRAAANGRGFGIQLRMHFRRRRRIALGAADGAAALCCCSCYRFHPRKGHVLHERHSLWVQPAAGVVLCRW